MSTRSILQVFSNYQKARVMFTQTIAELASKPHNIDTLNQANVLDLLKPLLQDPCPQIRQCAAVALGKLLDNDIKSAKKMVAGDFLHTLIIDLEKQNKYFKKTVLYVIKSICKHGASLASAVIQAGGLNAVIYCLGDFEPMVKEAALWAVGYMARHNQELAQAVVDTAALHNIILCMQEPELSIKQVAANALCDITKHSLGLAQNVVDSGAVPYLAKNLNNQDVKLKRVLLNVLGNIAKHSADLAECVVEAETFPNVLIHLGHACPRVRKQAACLTHDVAKHSLALTQMIVNLGGIGALVEAAMQDTTGEVKLPCYVCLGYIAGQNSQTAMSVMNCEVVSMLAETLQESDNDELLAVTAWALGQIGKHSPEHSRVVAAADVFPTLLRLYKSPNSSNDLQEKTKQCLKHCLQRCLFVAALEPLLDAAPMNILKYVLGQYVKILPTDAKARRLFVTSGCLKKIQEVEVDAGSTLMEYITIINSCFPDEIVRYYSPGYSDELLEMVEGYTPEMALILRDARMTVSEMQTDGGTVLDDATSAASRDTKALIF